MSIVLKPGTYVVAVSGGVDSMVLLHMLVQQALPEVRLVVAHLDHGMRDDSNQDRELVELTAKKYNLPFVYDDAALGPQANEETARQVRYEFLRRVQHVSGADAIITAHHQDDLVETAVHNLLRGTGRKGLSSLGESEAIKRPLLNFTKQQLKEYAEDNKLAWREDSTNLDTGYTRNYIRHVILPKFSPAQKKQLLEHIQNVGKSNKELDVQIANLLQFQNKDQLDKTVFVSLPHKVALEVMAEWLRTNGIRQFDTPLLEKLVTAAKTFKSGKRASVNKSHELLVQKDFLALIKRDR